MTKHDVPEALVLRAAVEQIREQHRRKRTRFPTALRAQVVRYALDSYASP